MLIQLLLCFVMMTSALAQTPVEVKMTRCVNSRCVYQGNFHPNGTLAVGEWDHYVTDLSGLTFKETEPLVFLPESVSAGGKISWWIQSGAEPTNSSYDQMLSNHCNQPMSCNFSSFGLFKCDPHKDKWYLSILNTGTNDTVTYDFLIAIQEADALSTIVCDSDLWKSLFALWIALIVIGFLCCFVLPIILIILCCCGCICGAAMGARQNYQSI